MMLEKLILAIGMTLILSLSMAMYSNHPSSLQGGLEFRR